MLPTRMILSFFVLLASSEMFSQQKYFPYRDGKVWGICNEQAKVLVKPEFDSVQLRIKEEKIVLRPYKKGKTGLFLGDKQIVPVNYEHIETDTKGIMFGIDRDENKFRTYELFDMNGKKIIPQAVYNLKSYDISGYSGVYHPLRLIMFETADRKESVFIWNEKAEKIEQWLFRDVHSIVPNNKNSPERTLLFHYKKTEKSPLETVVYEFKSGSFQKSSLTAKVIKPSTSSETYGEGYSLYGKDSGNNYIADHRDIKIGSDVAVPYPEEPEKTPAFVKVYVSYGLKEGKIEVRKGFSEKNIRLIEPDFTPDHIFLSGFAAGKEEIVNDTLVTFRNFVLYTYENKHGFWYKGPFKRTVEYDSILPESFSKALGEHKVNTLLFAGNYDKKTGKILYGLIDFEHKVHIPLEYELIDTQNKINYTDTSKKILTCWPASKNGQYGIITSENTVLLGFEYDFIGNNIKKGFLTTVKNGRYGVVIPRYSNGNQRFVEINPAFEYPVKAIRFSYDTGQKSEEQETMIHWVELADQNGKFMGYANVNGTLYFKD